METLKSTVESEPQLLPCLFQESLSVPACARLMSIHDKFHMMYKQKCAGDNPESFRLSKTFLSYHGFLRYVTKSKSIKIHQHCINIYFIVFFVNPK